ncbi:MAG: anaerobic ribonucleoside-triphosphate reductase activating protein [Clostridia bacterium]|nr:anaerobic ribonucleoside-triphosphate reductase activating protein [Clostridia bacterium]
MRIGGFQKLTLLDYPGKVACTVFLTGCDLRCPFCQNASLVIPGSYPPAIDAGEVLAYIAKRAGVLDGVCVSGGEPLMSPDVEDLIREIKKTGVSVKLDTNGTYPDRTEKLIEQGLVDYIAMDIKSSPENYALACGAEGVAEKVFRTADMLMRGDLPFEFRTTLVRGIHTASDMRSIADRLAGNERYFLQNYENSGEIISPAGLDGFTAEETEAFARILREKIPNAAVRSQ